MSCIFCKIIAGGIPSFKVMENEGAYAFLDINPAMRGHTLVAPKVHADDIFAIDAESLMQVTALTKSVATLLVDRLGAKGTSIFQFNRAEGGQSVFHLHFHVVPRWSADELKSPWTEAPGDMSELKATHDVLVAD